MVDTRPRNDNDNRLENNLCSTLETAQRTTPPCQTNRPDRLESTTWHRSAKTCPDSEHRTLPGWPTSQQRLALGCARPGKSSLIKAVFNAYLDQGLRIIEVDKDDLVSLPEIVDAIRDEDLKFILFCDDLSFEPSDKTYKHLKSVLEGSIEIAPDNVLIYATSNRRHLLPEKIEDNLGTKVVDNELHYTDTVEEQISLSDRFGLWLAFYPGSMDNYLQIVDSLFPNYQGDRETLHEAARLFAASRATKSGRTAQQFYNQHASSS